VSSPTNGHLLPDGFPKQVAQCLNDTPNPVVTQIGGWGAWVNGGSWLTIGGQRTDLLYRDLDFLNSTIDEVVAGHSRPDYWQQSPYGFHSQTYCAETRLCVPLYDPDDIISPLKEKVRAYPEALKRNVVNGFLWGLTHEIAAKFAHRQEPYLVVGCLTRIACELIQVVYALNETFFLGDKHVYHDIANFTVAPPDFMAKVDAMMGGGIDEPELERRIGIAIELRDDVMALAGDIYTPRY
jgi:hypothetical protein